MNAPENCGRAPPQACAGGAFGPQAKPSPAGDGFSGLRPLAPAAPGRPAARLSPCRNPAFIFNTNRIIQSNLYSFRQISRPLPFGRSASFAKVRIHRAKSMQGASLGNGRSPTPPRALCQAKEPGRSPLRLRRKRRPFRPAWPPFGRPGQGDGLVLPQLAARAAPRPFFGFYTTRTLSPNYTDIRQNPPWLCDYKCRVSFLPHQNSAEQFSERKSKITSSTMVLRLWERKMPLSGKGSPVRLR